MQRHADRPVEPFWLEGARGRLYSMLFATDGAQRHAKESLPRALPEALTILIFTEFNVVALPFAVSRCCVE